MSPSPANPEPEPPPAPTRPPAPGTAGVPQSFDVRWRREDRPPRVVPEPPPVARPVGGAGSDDSAGAVDVDRAPLAGVPASAPAVLRRVLGRLLGDAAEADRLAVEVLADGSDDLAVVVDAGLRAVLEHRGPLGEAKVRRVGGVPFADHRGRIARDLLRRDPPRRVVLALRHLAELGCSDVAAAVGWDEATVRQLTAAWRPADLDPARDHDGERPLAHLDPPRPFRT